MKNVIICGLALILGTGCAGAISMKTDGSDEHIHWNPQQYAGMTPRCCWL